MQTICRGVYKSLHIYLVHILLVHKKTYFKTYASIMDLVL
jgi:hypothetical protein